MKEGQESIDLHINMIIKRDIEMALLGIIRFHRACNITLPSSMHNISVQNTWEILVIFAVKFIKQTVHYSQMTHNRKWANPLVTHLLFV